MAKTPRSKKPPADGGKHHKTEAFEARRDAIVPEILQRIAEGESLRAILRDLAAQGRNPPTTGRFAGWCSSDQELANQYARAMEMRADAMFDELMEIADTPIVGERVEESDDGYKVVREDMLGHRRLQVDVRKWALARMSPKKYGEKLDLNHGGRVGVVFDRDDEAL